MIDKIVVTKKRGNKPYLFKYKEAYIVATSETDGSHVLPRCIQTFTDELQQVLHDLCGNIIGHEIKSSSSERYARRLIQRVNINEELSEGQKRIIITGMIKVSGLLHKR